MLARSLTRLLIGDLYFPGKLSRPECTACKALKQLRLGFIRTQTSLQANRCIGRQTLAEIYAPNWRLFFYISLLFYCYPETCLSFKLNLSSSILRLNLESRAEQIAAIQKIFVLAAKGVKGYRIMLYPDHSTNLIHLERPHC